MNSSLVPAGATLNGFEIDDIDEALERARPDLEGLRGASLFITGGTGFFGQWLLALLARADATSPLGANVTLLTRDADRFRRLCPELASRSFVRLHEGDVRTFDLPDGRYTHLVHGAADTGAEAARHPLELIDTIVGGTRHTLDFAQSRGIARGVLVSSGAIYGPQPRDMAAIAEDFPGADPTMDRHSAYGQAKRLAEHIAAHYNPPLVVARPFAFVGPSLPLDAHFAVGNFIRDAIAGGPVAVKGTGGPTRSYLYAADLAVWLLRLLVQGKPGRAYNVGSDQAISIADLAATVASVLPMARGVNMGRDPAFDGGRPRYVPSIERARRELRLDVWTPLDEALRRTARWAGRRQAEASLKGL